MELNVKGMACGHCEAAVARAVQGVAPQVEVAIDRAYGRVEIIGAVDAERIIGATRAVGFEVSRAD